MRSKMFLLFSFFLQSVFAKAAVLPADSIKHTKTKKIILGTGAALVAGGSLIYLNQAWYKPHATGNFHFFADEREWLQMDKAGHVWSTYQAGRLMMQSMRWAGYTKGQSELLGAYSGFAYMTVIELMDGFSSGYGFSWADMGSNAAGSFLAWVQEHRWSEQRMLVKFSFHQTSFPQYRPALLGNNLAEQILKDYNGQTYWLSVNVASFMKKESRFPKWLNLAFGYGASGMISGNDNYVYVGSDGRIVGNERYRKCFLSLDIDFSKIYVKSRILKGVFNALNCLKIPFPAIEFSKSGVKGQALYF